MGNLINIRFKIRSRSSFSITRPNWALDKRTSLCLYVPGFQKLIYKHVPKYKWIPLTKLPWIPRTYECNIILSAHLLCGGFRNKRI